MSEIVKYYEVQQSYLITNGHPSDQTISDYNKSGFILLNVSPAKNYHPYAAETDCISFWAKPIKKEEYDRGRDEWNKANPVNDATSGINA